MIALASIQLKPEIYEWQGATEILTEDYFKVNKTGSMFLKEITFDFKYKGIVLVGNVEVITDTVIYTKSRGAFGDTVHFNGANLVIIGLTLEELSQHINLATLNTRESLNVEKEASNIIKKVKTRLSDESIDINIEADSDPKYIIFGRKNFFLISSKEELVLIHRKQIAVRKKDSSLVQIDANTGITIVDKEKCFTIGGPCNKLDHSILGEIGLKISSAVLDNLVWE